jgi:hypothetical protein
MTDADIKEYEMQLREAQRMAENARNVSDKAAWLQIASQWLRMLGAHRSSEAPQGRYSHPGNGPHSSH